MKGRPYRWKPSFLTLSRLRPKSFRRLSVLREAQGDLRNCQTRNQDARPNPTRGWCRRGRSCKPKLSIVACQSNSQVVKVVPLTLTVFCHCSPPPMPRGLFKKNCRLPKAASVYWSIVSMIARTCSKQVPFPCPQPSDVSQRPNPGRAFNLRGVSLQILGPSTWNN